MPKVFIADKVAVQCPEILQKAGMDVEVNTGLAEDELISALKGCDGLVVRSATKVTAKVIKSCPDLKVVGRAGIGVDNIDVEAATASGVLVMNTPLGNVVSAAEHAVGLLLSLARNIPAADRSMKKGAWDKKKFTGVELSGKTLGLVGLGRVAQVVVRVAKALNMRVLAYDPYVSVDRAREIGVEKAEIDELAAEADFVSIHAPLTDQTRGLVGSDLLAKMKPTARLVNCARGGIVDEEALREALASGEIAGAAVDVFGTEPLPASSELRSVDGIVLTPHLGASTAEAQDKVAIAIAEQIADFLTSGKIVNALNVSVTLAPELAAYAGLAEQLASLCGQLVSAPVQKMIAGFHGSIAGRKDLHALSLHALKGLLAPTLDSPVTLVNAELLAEARGIELVESVSEKVHNYTNLITIELVTSKGTRTVGGTVFDGREARIVALDDFEVELKPAPNLLVMAYRDRPGMVGTFGSILGKAKINIAAMAVGRRTPHGRAIVALTLDDPVPDEVCDAIRKAINPEEIHRVRL